MSASHPLAQLFPPGEYLTHLAVTEAGEKHRFLILVGTRGALTLHKAKQNTNLSYSIGKTWSLDSLATITVHHQTAFSLEITSKAYRYDTAKPTSVQATFLVALVRKWRLSYKGRSVNLVGFSVDSPSPNPSATSNDPRNLPPPQRRNAPPNQTFPSAGSRNASVISLAASSSSQLSQQPPPSISNRNPSFSSSSGGQNGGREMRPGGGSVSGESRGGGDRRDSFRRDGGEIPAVSTNGSSKFNQSLAIPPSSSSATLQQRERSPSPFSAPSAVPREAVPVPRPAPQLARTLTNPPSSAPPSIKIPTLPSSSFIATYKPPPTVYTEDELEAQVNLINLEQKAQEEAVARAAAAEEEEEDKILVEPEFLGVDQDVILNNVEEMLHGFDWGTYSTGAKVGDREEGAEGEGRLGRGSISGTVSGGRGKTDEIEKSLIGELKALEAASIHAIIESDDRINGVLSFLDDGMAELERMELTIGMYLTQLNLMADEIFHIEGQNRGLQVLTSNQRLLLGELDLLMETIHIPANDLMMLVQESLENSQGIERLERGLVSLYKALLANRDTPVGEMLAANENMKEYKVKGKEFCKRLNDFLSIMFLFQADQMTNPPKSKDQAKDTKLVLPNHEKMSDFLGRYCGLMLFVKEMDGDRYKSICDAYLATMAKLHKREIEEFLAKLKGSIVKRGTGADEEDANFSMGGGSPTLRQGGSIRRAGTVMRSPLEITSRKDSSTSLSGIATGGKLTGSEGFSLLLSQLLPRITHQTAFISDLLHICPLESLITFADYMTLDNYFRRGATKFTKERWESFGTLGNALDTLFAGLGESIAQWIDSVVRSDNMQIIGILVQLDVTINQFEQQRNQEFILKILRKLWVTCLGELEKHLKEQILSIEQTKLTLKKRNGVVPFVRIFPLFVNRVEAQLAPSPSQQQDLSPKMRKIVDDNFERIISSIFESLLLMAKMDGAGETGASKDKDEDKAGLNYCVVIIENMHHLLSSFSKFPHPVLSLSPFLEQAQELYNDNLQLYIRLILRRPFARFIDFFNSLEVLLRTTPPTEVSLHSAFTKSSTRKVLSSISSKEVKKLIEVLWKRVEKHFLILGGGGKMEEGNEMVRIVWREIERSLCSSLERWGGMMRRCYEPGERGIEFTIDEVRSEFKKVQA